MQTLGGRRCSRATGKVLLAALGALAAGAFAGCSLHRADLSPAPLKGGRASALGKAPESPREAWWRVLGDAPLDTLVTRALADNFDARASHERINQALSAYRRSRSVLWPQIEGNAAIDEEVFARGRSRLDTRRELGLSLNWTPDLFGRQRGTRQARAAEAWLRIYETDTFRLGLSVDVAEAYYGIVEQRWLLRLLGEQQATARQVLRLIEQRYQEGLISNVDVLQQQSQLAELDTQIPVARAALEDLQNRLGVLLGAAPGEVDLASLGEGVDFPLINALPPLPEAGDLLFSRPDLRAAKAALVAADADSGRALAERLPSLSLTGDALRVEGRGPGVTSVSLGAELVQPLLDWGSRRAEWMRTRSVYRERLNTFTQAYLRAVWQVDSLVKNETRQRELLASLEQRRSLLESTIKLARSRYDSGLTDYLPVLSATQQFYSVEQRLVRERRRLTTLRIALHEALGGPAPEPGAEPIKGPAFVAGKARS